MALKLFDAAQQPATAIQAPQVDVPALQADLRRHVEGEVRFDDGSRALYATDASHYRQVPIGVVVPRNIDDHLRDQTQEKYYLVFGPDPATHGWCTFGGMLGNNACGVHAVMSGRASENVEEMEILTYDGVRLRVGPTSEADLERIIREGGRRGEIYQGLKDIRDCHADLIRQRYPDIPRCISGYNLDELLPEKGFNVARALITARALTRR